MQRIDAPLLNLQETMRTATVWLKPKHFVNHEIFCDRFQHGRSEHGSVRSRRVQTAIS
jgi:hypothetical protein